MRKALKPLWSLGVALVLSLLLASVAMATTLSGENKGILPLNGVPHAINNLTVDKSFVTFHLDTAMKFSMVCSVPYAEGMILFDLYKGTPGDCTRLAQSDDHGTLVGGICDTKFAPAYLTKGDYAIELHLFHQESNNPPTFNCILTAATSPLPADDEGDNNTLETATPIGYPGSAQGIVASGGDVDCYKFTLAEAGPVELSVRNMLGENTMHMEVLSGETTVYEAAMKATAPNQLFVRRLYLDAGSHTVSLQLDGEYKHWGFAYSLGVRLGDPIENAWMPSTRTFTLGIPAPLFIAMSDTYMNCAQFDWTSDKTSVATVNDNGVVTGVSPGSCTIRATSPDGRYSLQSKATVKDNVFTRSKPYVGKRKGFYGSAKKMYYRGDRLYVEIFVYNKMGFTTPKLHDWFGVVYYIRDWGTDEDGNAVPIFGCAAYESVDIPAIRNNRYTVVKVSFDMTGRTRMDLRSKQFEALVCDYDTLDGQFEFGTITWKHSALKRSTPKPRSWNLQGALTKEGK